MKLNVYAVFDVKAANYGTPFFMTRDGEAHRAFTDLVNDPRSRINPHPGDYSLFNVGIYDDSSSEIVSHKPLLLVQGAAVYVEIDKNQVPMPGIPLKNGTDPKLAIAK